MRTSDNSKFTLHKTATQDWYLADEVDQRIAELEKQIAAVDEAVMVADLGTLEGTYGGDVKAAIHDWLSAWCGVHDLDNTKRIAELEQSRLKWINDCDVADVKHQEALERIAELEETRVTDELLEKLVDIVPLGESSVDDEAIRQAEAILDKRKGGE